MRRKVALAAAVAAVAGVAWLVGRPSHPPPRGGRFLPALSGSSYLNAGPDAGYVGIAACKECHRGNYESYLHTAHSRAFNEVDAAAEPPDGSFEHAPSGRSYRVYRRGGRLRHQETLRTPQGQEVARLDLPVPLLIGSGRFARTYLAEVDGFLNESPITWYASRKRWAISPGYERPVHFSFQRAVTADCLTCHVGRVQPASDGGYQVAIAEQPIGCESCHGPGSRHAEYQRTAKHPSGADDLTIVNPGKLPRPLLEAVCAACHLQGVAHADVRGRTLTDFRPGRPLTDYRIHYQFNSQNEQMTVVGHLEQLRQSACYQKSGELSCLSCHDPHLRHRPKDAAAYYRQKCLGCHDSRVCALKPAERLEKSPVDDCTACHMPRGDTEVPHIAFTHHRIGRHPSSPQPPLGGVTDLVAIDDAPQLTETDRKRNLGLAYLEAAFKAPDRDQALAYNRRARDLLQSVYDAGLRDGVTLEELATIHLHEQNFLLARFFAREALAATDLSIDAHLKALQALFESYLHDEEVEEAIAVLEQLVRLRRSSSDWRTLGDCYLATGQTAKALHAFEKALAINPFNHLIHAGLAEVYRQRGELPRAAEHARQAEWLAQRSKS